VVERELGHAEQAQRMSFVGQVAHASDVRVPGTKKDRESVGSADAIAVSGHLINQPSDIGEYPRTATLSQTSASRETDTPSFQARSTACVATDGFPVAYPVHRPKSRGKPTFLERSTESHRPPRG
jgi:hypothetical protein